MVFASRLHESWQSSMQSNVPTLENFTKERSTFPLTSDQSKLVLSEESYQRWACLRVLGGQGRVETMVDSRWKRRSGMGDLKEAAYLGRKRGVMGGMGILVYKVSRSMRQWLTDAFFSISRFSGRPQTSHRATTQEGHPLQGPQVRSQSLRMMKCINNELSFRRKFCLFFLI